MLLVRFLTYLGYLLMRIFGFTPEVSHQEEPRLEAEKPFVPPLLIIEQQKPAVSQKLHPLDDLENWGKEFTNQPPLSASQIAEWQKRFDGAFGLNRDGKSCFRLAWNGDRRHWHKFGYDWDAYGKAIKWEERPRILWKKVELGNGDYVDLFPPRWLILMRIEPEQFADQWKKESWVFDASRGTHGQNKQIRDDEVPSVYWDTFEVIGEHDAFCCDVFEGECFGAFRNPNDKDLERLHQLKQAFEARKQSPYEKLSERTEAEIARFTQNYYRQQYAKMPASSEIVIENADAYLAPLLTFTGDKFSEREKKNIVKSAMDRHYSEKADQFEQRLRGN